MHELSKGGDHIHWLQKTLLTDAKKIIAKKRQNIARRLPENGDRWRAWLMQIGTETEKEKRQIDQTFFWFF